MTSEHSHTPHHVSALERLTQGLSTEQADRIGTAFALAEEAGEKDSLARPRGVDVALILRGVRVDAECLLAALLSDPYLRENLTAGVIRDRFGTATAELVEKANWLNTFTDCRDVALREPEQAELLRRMLLAVVNDVRAVLIKLGYRLQRLRLMRREDSPLRHCLARETLDLFAPLANRLGVAQLKWELEDLSFRYLYPDEYAELKRHLAETRLSREAYVQDFMAALGQLLRDEGMDDVKLDGRPKHIYSIWRKMQRKRVGFDELYDLRAVRVTVGTTAECYTVLGLVHGHWQHVPKEFDDYIANPKPNGYRSLHTVVVGPEGKPVEVQIRTAEMHTFAEYGVAAHWRYKEGGRHAAFDRSIALMRGLLENRDDDHTLLENFRLEALGQDVFVLTPKQRILRLPLGATPLDFAYAVHTEVGHRCRGAKVNGRMVPLTYVLRSGEQVEILTAKQGSPSRHWVEPASGFLKSASARAKVRQWFKQQDHERTWRQGKVVFDREKQRLRVKELDQAALLARFPYKRWEDFLAAVGRGEITAPQLALALVPAETAGPVPLPPRKPVSRSDEGRICIPGVPNPLVHFARCCQPQMGDAVVGYISINRGVAVHRRDCANIRRLGEAQHSRLIPAYWQGAESAPIDIEVRAQDRRGLLRDVTQILSSEHMEILSAFTHGHPGGSVVTVKISVEQTDRPTLEAALRRIKRLTGVMGTKSNGPG